VMGSVEARSRVIDTMIGADGVVPADADVVGAAVPAPQ